MATFDDFERAIRTVESSVLSAANVMKLGKIGRDIIYKRVKSGLGVNNDRSDSPNKQDLKPLSPSYIAQRQRKGVKGKFGSPSRSNLTNTGEMLESMTVQARKEEFTILVPNTRRTDGKNNKRVSEFVSEQGRPFLNLTRDERQILLKEVENQVRRIFNQALGS